MQAYRPFYQELFTTVAEELHTLWIAFAREFYNSQFKALNVDLVNIGASNTASGRPYHKAIEDYRKIFHSRPKAAEKRKRPYLNLFLENIFKHDAFDFGSVK